MRLEIRGHAHIERLSIHWEPGEPARLVIDGTVRSAVENERLAIVAAACQREVVRQEIAAGGSFELVVAVDDWPRWPDACDEPVLTPVEIRLLAGGRTMWQTVIETAPPQADHEEPRKAMLERLRGDKPLDWFDYMNNSDAAFQDILNRPGTVIGLRGILADAAYTALDRANVGVVQTMPAAWAATVRGQFGHHPSIIAWVEDGTHHGGTEALRK